MRSLLFALLLLACCAGPTRDRSDTPDEQPPDESADAGAEETADAGEAADGGDGRDAGGAVDAGRLDGGPRDGGSGADAGPCAGWQEPAIANPNCGPAPLTSRFNGTGLVGDMDLQDIRWDFGDGDYSYELDPQHVYRRAGDYEASVSMDVIVHTEYGSSATTINLKPIRIRAH